MVTKHITQLVDDVDGTVLESGEGKQLTFSVDGRDYEIDLSIENADKFYSAVAPYVDAARRVGSPASSQPKRESRATNQFDLNAVREWARANGHKVSDRGRVAKSVIDMYADAKG